MVQAVVLSDTCYERVRSVVQDLHEFRTSVFKDLFANFDDRFPFIHFV